MFDEGGEEDEYSDEEEEPDRYETKEVSLTYKCSESINFCCI